MTPQDKPTALPAPNHTQIPNIILDNMAAYTHGEVLILMAACRNTIGWHRETAPMSITWFINITGLSRQGVLNARDSLMEQGVLVEKENRGPNGVKLYSVCILADDGTPLVNSVDPQAVNSVDPLKKVVKEKDSKDSTTSSKNEEVVSPPTADDAKPIQSKTDEPVLDKCVVNTHRCPNCTGMLSFKEGNIHTCQGCGQITVVRKAPPDTPAAPLPSVPTPMDHKAVKLGLCEALAIAPETVVNWGVYNAVSKDMRKMPRPPLPEDFALFRQWDLNQNPNYLSTNPGMVGQKWASFMAWKDKPRTRMEPEHPVKTFDVDSEPMTAEQIETQKAEVARLLDETVRLKCLPRRDGSAPR
jgi:hypothetical protein